MAWKLKRCWFNAGLNESFDISNEWLDGLTTAWRFHEGYMRDFLTFFSFLCIFLIFNFHIF